MPSYDRRDPQKAYDQVTEGIRKVMLRMEEKIRPHSHKQSEKPEDWGWVGDVTEVLKRLQEAHDFLT